MRKAMGGGSGGGTDGHGGRGQVRSNAAEYLIREEIAAACDGGAGSIDPTAVIERDLTGDGRADLIISHEGIGCAGRGAASSAACRCAR